MTAVPNPPPPCVTVAMLAAQWQCSLSFVYDEIKAGRLIAMRFGPKLLRIRKTDVLAYEAAAAATVIANIRPEPIGIPIDPTNRRTIAGHGSARLRTTAPR